MPFWIIYVIWCVCVRTIVGSIDKVAHNILLHAWLSKLWLNTLNWVFVNFAWWCGLPWSHITTSVLLWFRHKLYIFSNDKNFNKKKFERTIFWEGKWKIFRNIKKTEINQLFRRRLLKLPMYHGIPLNRLEIVSMVSFPTRISCELYLKKFSM